MVNPSGDISQPFFSVKGQKITVNGDEVQVFEYLDAVAADAEAALISPDGSSIGTTMINWVTSPHFYRKDKLIVLYVGDATAIVNVLETVLGPQFSGENGKREITNFEECAEAGNPVTASYPRQCRVNGKTFAEEI